MTPIDPAGRTTQGALLGASDTPAFDPAAVLLALSVQQMGIMQSALVNQISGGQNQLSRIGELGSAASKLPKLFNQAQQTELGQVNQVLGQIESLRQKYAGGDTSSLVVNDADNDRLNELAEWAAERGYLLAPMTKLELPNAEEKPPVAEEGESTVNGAGASESATVLESPEGATAPPAEPEPDPQPQLVIDAAGVEQNIKKLQSYLADLKAGVADNPALRQTIAELPGMATLSSQLRRLGLTAPLNALEQISDAVPKLQHMAQTAVQQLAGSAAAIHSFASQITEKAADLAEFLHSFNDDQQRHIDRDQFEAQLAQMELEKQFREALLEVEAQLAEAARLINSHYIPADVRERFLNNLSSVQQQQLDNELSSWKTDFESQLAAAFVPPKLAHHSAAAMRRDYL